MNHPDTYLVSNSIVLSFDRKSRNLFSIFFRLGLVSSPRGMQQLGVAGKSRGIGAGNMTKYIIESSDSADANLTARLVPSGKVLVKGTDGVTVRRVAADTLAKRGGDVLATLKEFYLTGDNAHYYRSVTKVD